MALRDAKIQLEEGGINHLKLKTYGVDILSCSFNYVKEKILESKNYNPKLIQREYNPTLIKSDIFLESLSHDIGVGS